MGAEEAPALPSSGTAGAAAGGLARGDSSGGSAVAHASSCGGGCSWGRSNLGWEREDAGLMIAFDFVILAVIALSRNLKDSVWKCSQIITIIQKEGKIVFLPVRMESAIKNTPEPPSPFLLARMASCPALRNLLHPLRGQSGTAPLPGHAAVFWGVLHSLSCCCSHRASCCR